MATYTFALQHTGRPYAPAERIPADAWSEYSRHTSLQAAERALRWANTKMTRRCGTGWDDHYRIIALKDTSIVRCYLCLGYIGEDGHHRHCDAMVELVALWRAGEPAPAEETPEGWASPYQCGRCAALERGAACHNG